MRARAGGILLVVLAVAGCGVSQASPAAPTAKVLYAGSLVGLMEHDLGPAFAKATGDGYQGYGAGSSQVAHEIEGGVRRGDVFISASPTVSAQLRAQGGITWYAAFATAPLVLAYNPHSRFALDLESKPWTTVLREPGIRVGRTDPAVDPKGTLTVTALHQAFGADSATVADGIDVFPEEELVGRLDSGQLDAGFFYRNEATEQHLPTVGLGSVHLAATYTVSSLAHPADPSAAAAFVRYLLGPAGTAILRAHGLTVGPATVTGSVPSWLRAAPGA